VDFESDGDKPIKVIKKFMTTLKFDTEEISTFTFGVNPNIVEVDK